MVEDRIAVLGSTEPSGSSVVAEENPWHSGHWSAPRGFEMSFAEATAATAAVADADSVVDRRCCEWEED